MHDESRVSRERSFSLEIGMPRGSRMSPERFESLQGQNYRHDMIEIRASHVSIHLSLSTYQTYIRYASSLLLARTVFKISKVFFFKTFERTIARGFE